MIFLYRTLRKRVSESHSQAKDFEHIISIIENDVFTLADFELYLINDIKKEDVKLRLFVTKEFYDMLTAE
jgi:hypothetical protein